MTDAHSPVHQKEFLRVEEVAQLLDVSRDTVYRHVRSGTLPSTRLGRLWLIPRRALERWAARHHPGKITRSGSLLEAMQQAAELVDPGDVDELMQAIRSARTDTVFHGDSELFP